MEDHRKQITGVILFMVTVTLVSGQLCPNCRSPCNETGFCSGDCVPGWDGPTCSRRNVALNRSTEQSSDWTSDDISYVSRFGVDGKTGHSLFFTPCTRTDINLPAANWTVTLDARYNIYRFRIYNRNDPCGTLSCGRRLKGFSLSVGNSSENYKLCYQDSTTSPSGPGAIVNGVCNGGPVFGDTVRIMINNSETLSLCEVQIFVCTPGTYGEDCGKRCGLCAEGPSVCNTTSGSCPERTPMCMPGYSGQKCDTGCTSGNYGADCEGKCGNCAGGPSVCNTTSGHCPQAKFICMTGYSPPKCDTRCIPGKYGPDCKMNCGNCSQGKSVCDPSSGHCPNLTPRCMPGYSGVTCEMVCGNSTWGDDCSETCGRCYNKTQCDTVTGECPIEEGNPRCDPEYTGNDCMTLSEKASNGNKIDPGSLGGGLAAAAVLVAIVVVVVIVILRKRRRQASKPSRENLPVGGRIFQPENMAPQDNIVFEEDNASREDEPQDDVNPYVNADVYSTIVFVEEFPDYFMRTNAGKGFEKEFKTFLVGLQAEHTEADKPRNKAKSRYRSLVAYDHSRVLLSVTDDQDTDYINACYINGYKEPKKYIASQGPNDVILNDFLRMIWEQQSGKIVMVTNLVEATKTKCCQYWPDQGGLRFGLIMVTLLDEENYAEFTVRTLQLTHIKRKKEPYIVKQFHFKAWPDHGAPAHATALLDFRDKVNSYQTTLSGPIVVHCSAGVGRTGTYIALDYLIAQAHDEGVVDVPACVRQLREQRVNMVQTLEQYKFLHDALAEALKLQSSSVPGAEFPRVFAELCTPDPETGRTKMAEQFQSLQRMTDPQDKIVLTAARHPDNVSKNRSNRILAADTCRPYLSTPVPDGNNYINAVYLPTFRSKRGLIITQTPLPGTIVDFWRLVYDHSITTIVMLDVVKPGDKDFGIYWPVEGEQFDSFVVKVKDKQECERFSVWTYHLSHKDTKAEHPIKQFRCKFWAADPTPSSIASLLSVVEDATKWQLKTGNVPILVHCRDGATKSGLFCVAASVIERLEADQEVNIVHSVKQMRTNRPQIITDLNQFHFLHQVAMGYLETVHTYANYV